MGRHAVALVLTEDEQDELVALTRRKRSAQQVAMRARIVLACAGGLANHVVAARLGVSRQMVCRWRVRFAAQRLDGLYDERRPGTPRTVGDAKVQ